MTAGGLKVVRGGGGGGTGGDDDARLALDAAAHELPSAELTRRMAAGLGLSSAVLGVTATAAVAKASVGGGAKAAATSSLLVPALSVGLVAVAVTGVVLGVRWSQRSKVDLAAVPVALSVAQGPVPLPVPTTTRAEARSGAPAAVPVVTRKRARPIAVRGDFQAEIALVDSARAAVLAREDQRALSLLDLYDRTYRGGTFQAETMALRIETLARLGRTARARTLAAEFIARHPDSPLGDRVARAAGMAPR